MPRRRDTDRRWLLLGEPVSLMSIIGAVLITVGVICALKKTEK